MALNSKQKGKSSFLTHITPYEGKTSRFDETDRKRSEEQVVEAYEKSRKYLKIFGGH